MAFKEDNKLEILETIKHNLNEALIWHLTNTSEEVIGCVSDYLMRPPEVHKSPLDDYAAFRWTRDMLWDATKGLKNAITREYISQRIGETLASKAMILIPGIDPDFLTRLSEEHYESSSSKGLSVILLPSEAAFHQISDCVAFHESDYLEFIPENSHAVRKQMNLTPTGSIKYPSGQKYKVRNQKWLLAAAYYAEKNIFRTVGLVSESALRESTINHLYRVSFPGHMHWELCFQTEKETEETNDSYSCLIQYRGGLMHFPDDPLERVFSVFFKRVVSEVFPQLDANQKDDLLAIVLNAKHNANKGTVLVFANPEDIQKEVIRLVGISHRGTHFFQDGIHNMREKLSTLKSFTSVDGALLIDTGGNCHAFGVILDGAVPPGEEGKGNPARGAKFNCSKTYILSREFPALGVVLSEDGMVDLLRKAPEDARKDVSPAQKFG